jgi:DNA-directed RNA polymerase subunit L
MDFNIKIKKIYYNIDEFMTSKLTINLSGNDINGYIINTLRRIMFDDVLIHSINTHTIEIEQNTSIYSNDELKLRLSTLPLYGIKNNLIILDQEYLKLHKNDVKYHKDEDVFKLYINTINNTQHDLCVTTNDLIIYKNNDKIDNFYDKNMPILLLVLNPKETLICYMVSKISMGNINNIFAGCAMSYYKKYNDHNYDFSVESKGNYREDELLIKACETIIQKLKKIDNNFVNYKKKQNSEDTFIFEFINEDYTIGNILNNDLVNDPDIIFSSIDKSDQLVNNINLIIKIKNGNVNEKIHNSINKLINKYDYIKKIIKKIII